MVIGQKILKRQCRPDLDSKHIIEAGTSQKVEMVLKNTEYKKGRRHESDLTEKVEFNENYDD